MQNQPWLLWDVLCSVSTHGEIFTISDDVAKRTKERKNSTEDGFRALIDMATQLQLIALKLWSANTSSGNYSCRERHAFIIGLVHYCFVSHYALAHHSKIGRKLSTGSKRVSSIDSWRNYLDLALTGVMMKFEGFVGVELCDLWRNIEYYLSRMVLMMVNWLCSVEQQVHSGLVYQLAEHSDSYLIDFMSGVGWIRIVIKLADKEHLQLLSSALGLGLKQNTQTFAISLSGGGSDGDHLARERDGEGIRCVGLRYPEKCFADTHNLVAFLEKPTESEGFEEIVDFLNTNPIKYALTVNPTIYFSCVKQFWDTVKAKTVNGEVQLQALVDKKKVIITESTIRRDLQLEDANGVDCLPNAAIFEQLTLMGKSKKKNTKVPQPSGSPDNVPDENVSTTSNDPLLSGEDRPRLTELMDLCTNLQKKVLDLEKAKTAQDSEIASLKKKVKKLERRNKSRTPGLKRLKKVGSARRVESSDEASLGDQEDASKQGRKIANIDADAEVTLIDETQGRNDDNLMFDTCVLDKQEVEVEKVVSTAEVTTESATKTTIDELTLAQTLIEIKDTKPKVRGVMIQEPSEFTTTTTTTTPAASKPSQDKGKAKMIESEKPLKKKDQIMYDQEVALNLQAQLQAELEEEERLTRQKEEEANIALIESWDNTQAMMDADYQMAQQLQANTSINSGSLK
ncbi:hypothetical protein Tco_1321156 [Tanacetum coccineum]